MSSISPEALALCELMIGGPHEADGAEGCSDCALIQPALDKAFAAGIEAERAARLAGQVAPRQPSGSHQTASGHWGGRGDASMGEW